MTQRFPLTLTQLSYFTECAKTLSMTAASQELHVAQSAISTAISQLERTLGTELFIRVHSKGLVLTAAGENLLRNTRQIFGHLADTIDSIRADQGEIRGTITIACFNTLAPIFLPQLLTQLKESHPGLFVEVIEGDFEDNMTALRGGAAELALNYAFTKLPEIDHEIVGEVRPHILLPADHKLANRNSIMLSELEQEPFVLLDQPSSREHFLSLLRHAAATPKVLYRTAGYETVRAMVASGLGFSILHQRPNTQETYAGQRVSIVEIDDDVPSLQIAVSTLEQIRHSARAEVVVEAIRRVVEKNITPQS